VTPPLSAVRIALVYPELLGTYGDGGNAEILARRASWRGFAAEIVSVSAGDPVPSGCDIYVLGGGEDGPQSLAAEGLAAGNGLERAITAGAVMLAICAGYQVVGESFPGSDGAILPGLGLLPLRTRRGLVPGDLPPRAVGDLVVRPDPVVLGADLPLLTGYENHGGRTMPLDGAPGRPLGEVVLGVGNGTSDHGDGWVSTLGTGWLIGTYLHGPALAQNPELADLLLGRVLGELPPLPRAEPTGALRAARQRQLGL
jgi:lipid II isoglutaminyl synthase (glutamine-hydrolysing)